MKKKVKKGGETGTGKSVPGEKKSPGRSDRLARALRENLRKRKAQAEARRSGKG